MEMMVVVMIVIAVVVANRMKVAAQEQKARQERMQQQARTQETTFYDPAQAAAPVPQPPQSAQMPFHPTEGVAFHPPGFHGDESDKKPRVSGSMVKKPLEKADLGAERAKQNAHTAVNAQWSAPKEAHGTQEQKPARRPMYTAKQLRNAFIMQEIIDVPVSRRKGIKRGYGS